MFFDYEDGLEGAEPIEAKIPFSIAIPTTAGTGSEVGGSFVVSRKDTGKKVIVWSSYLVPNFVIGDPELLVSLPSKVTATTGVDALVHNMEAFLVNSFHPMCDGIALEGIRLVHKSLVTSYRDPHNLEARSDMLVASMMGATAFQKGLGVNHSCAHALSEAFDLHHGLANALMMSACMEFNFESCPEKFERMGRIIGLNENPGEAFLNWLSELRKDLDLSFGLREVGCRAFRSFI